MSNAAASPFSGSVGFGYRRSCGRKTSNMLIMSNIGDQVWLITSRQTDPDLRRVSVLFLYVASCDIRLTAHQYLGGRFDWRNRCWDSCMGIDLVTRREFSINHPRMALYTVSHPVCIAASLRLTLCWALKSNIEFLPAFRRLVSQRLWFEVLLTLREISLAIQIIQWEVREGSTYCCHWLGWPRSHS